MTHEEIVNIVNEKFNCGENGEINKFVSIALCKGVDATTCIIKLKRINGKTLYHGLGLFYEGTTIDTITNDIADKIQSLMFYELTATKRIVKEFNDEKKAIVSISMEILDTDLYS